MDSSVNWTHSWRRSLSYRNQPTDLQSESLDWFLYDRDPRHERVKSYRIETDQLVGNKAKRWISKRWLQEDKARQIFQKNEAVDCRCSLKSYSEKVCKINRKIPGICFNGIECLQSATLFQTKVQHWCLSIIFQNRYPGERLWTDIPVDTNLIQVWRILHWFCSK